MTAKMKDKKMHKTKHGHTSHPDSQHHCACHKRSSLGALFFHSDVKGSLISLCDGGRRAFRDESSFRYGLVFSQRPLNIQEKVCMRVERSAGYWHGSLRVGFTNVSPENTSVPPLAIPNLTDSPLYAAAVVPDSTSSPGSEIEFWIDRRGNLCIRGSDGTTSIQSTSLKVHLPMWAMVDVYGKTTAVMLLGSKKKGLIRTYRSCPALTHNTHKDNSGYGHTNKDILEGTNTQDRRIHNTGAEAFDCEECVVCCNNVSDTLLSCGHKCVCAPCAIRVYEKFGSCPLCRQCLRHIRFK